tara:strand:+ start:512 stop:844 length:333 start_codon:yes stop_codon:yes gene_type:complete
MNITVVHPKLEKGTQYKNASLFHVILLNDNDHSYDYVIEMLQKLFYFSKQQAYNHTVEVDFKGKTILITCTQKEAEFCRDQIRSYGPDPRIARCQSSMSAVVEPAASSTK